KAYNSAVSSVSKTYDKAVATVKKEASKYTIKLDVKQSIGIQAGVETPIGEVKVNAASVVITKNNITLQKGKVTNSTKEVGMDIKKDGTGEPTHKAEIESSAGVQLFNSGVEVGQSFSVTGSNLYSPENTQSS